MEAIDEGTINHDNFKWIFPTRIHAATAAAAANVTGFFTRLTHWFTVEMWA